MSLHDHTMHQASGSASDHRGRQSARLRYKHLAFGVGLALGSLLVCGVASAASGVSATESPTGGKVIGGAGSITQHGAETIVKQQSKLLALDWQTFNVGKDASVLFDQPSFNAVALNRILDQNPSQIFGKISSNGQIFLINTHGIIFGSTAQLNVGGLVASTLDLTPDDFLSRHFSLDAHGGHAGIVNHGTIAAARGGSISLIGGNVQNSGLIVADYGRINLDGADKAVLDFDGDGLINVQITGALQKRFDSEQAAVANKGTLKSTSGNVVLQASAAKDLFTNLVNNSGVIDAHGISTDGGVVRLVGHGGNTVSSGSIDVSGVHGGGAQLLSDHDVTVTGSVVASGASGGGSIRVGGGARGGEGLLRATNTTIGSGAVLDADATQNGNGGSIAVWGNDHADVAGVLSARGGAQGGHGGAIETSAEHVYIADGTRVNTLAARGASGTWLIDPQDFTVAASGGDITGAQLGTNLGTSSVTILSSTGGTGGSGNINVNDAVNWSANTLTLTAANDVNINAVMTASGTAGLALNPATANGADGAVAGGTVNVMPGSGRVDFTGTGNSLSIGGTSYTIITSLGASNSTTKADLQGIDGDLTGHYALGADIDATATSGWGGGKGFKPLGDDTTNFSGVFDGLGHTISNLNINTSSSYAGLFGAVGSGGTVRNVGLVGGSVASSAGSAAVSRAYVGSLTGFNLGTVSNVFAGTLVSDGQGYTNVGGLVGYNTGTIKQAYATGAVNGGGSYTGGLVGLNNGGSITDAYATGAVAGANAVGGLVGGSVGTITDAYATGTVSGGSVGGLVGVDGGGTVTNGYWDVQTTGVASSGGGTALTTAQLQSGLPAGFSNSTWSIVAGASFPYLSSQFAPGATPVAVSGTVFTDAGTTVAGGVTVNALNSGNALGATTTYGNGYFYYLFDPSVLSGSNVLVYAENYGSGGAINGAGFADGYATLPALDIFGNTLNVYTGATAWSTVLADLAGTEGGGATAATALTTGLPVTGLASLGVAAQGALGFDAALDWGGNLGVTAQGAITQTGTGNLTISGSSDLDAGTGAITLANTGNDFVGGVTAAGTGVALTDANSLTIVSLDGGTGDVTLDASGGTLSVNGAVSGKNVSLSGSSGISLAGNVSSSGTQAYNDAVALGANVTASSSGSGNIDFASTVDGAHALAVNTGGATTFGGAVGGTTALTSLTTNAGGSTTLDGNVNTTGAQTYNDAVTLGADAIAASSGGGAIRFNSTVDGAHALTVNTSGATTFGGAVGGTTVLTSLATNAGGSTTLDGNVNTTAAQTYNDAVTLGADAIAASSGGGTISFNSTVDGAHALAVNTSGITMFGGAVGGTTALTSLATNSGGSTTLDGNVSTTGAQAYGDAVSLGANVTAASSGSGNIDFASTVDGAHALAVNTGGATTFGGAVGGTTALTSLTTNAGGSTTLDGNVNTTGAQTYNDAVNLGGDASLASSGSGNIEFASSVDGAHNLAVNTGGQTAFGTVGGTTALTSLTTDAGGTIALNGNVSTTGAQTYNDAVTLGADAIAASSGGGTISFNSTVDGGYALTVDTGGAAVFGGAVGGTMKLAGLDSDSSTFSANALQVVGDLSVTTTSGGISQGGAWGVGGASNFDAGTNAITLANAGNDFTGAVSLSGGTVQITDTNALALGTLSTGTLTATSTGALNLGSGTVNGNLGATSTGGAISQSGALTVTGSSSLDAGGGSVTLANANNDFQGAVTASGAGVELTDVSDLNIASLTNSGNGDVSLIAGGALFGVGAIDAGTGNITLAANGGALNTATLTGGDITLTGAGGIVLGSNVTAGGALSLTSGSTISQNLGTVITADSLTGSSVGSTILEGNNAIGSLSDFTAAGFSLTSGQALTVATGAVVDGGASTTLTTTGAGSDLTLDGIVRGTTTELTSSGTITQGSAGIIDAGTLTGSSAGDTTLGGANQIDTVAQFGADDFTLVNAAALTVQGPLVTTGNISLTTTGPGNVLSVGQALTGGMISLDSAGDLSVVQAIQGTTINLAANGNLAIDAAINSGSGVTTLVQNGASGTISQSGAGTITAGTLTGAAQGSVALTGANAIATLGDFSAEGFSLTNAGALTVAAGSTVDGGDSTVLKTGGDLTIDGNVAGTLTSLVSSGAINEGSAGTITAGILTGSAAHAAQLTGHNAIDNIGNFKANGLALTNGQALTVLAGATVDGGANAALTITGTGGNLSINGTLKATTTKLLASGAIGEGVQGSLQAGTLTGGSTGSTSLTSANNAVANLGNFTANGFALTSGQALTIAAGSTLDGKASTTLTTTGAGHDLGIDGTVKGGLVTLVSSGAIGEGAGGRVQAGGLTGSSVGDTKLTQTGIDELNAFNAKNFYLTNAKALAVGGPVTTTGNAGDISLATSGTGNALTVNQAVKGAVITLASAGDLTVANAVTGTAVNLAANGNLLIDAAVDSGAGTTTLAQTGSGAITSGANGSITAATLTGSATGATTLGSAGQFMGNHVGILGGFSSPAGFSLTNDATLTLASVNGSAFTVDAGTSNLYLAVHNGDLLQTGTSWAYDGTGTWSASGHIGLANAPIYVTGTSPQIVAAIGLPPAYFYAVDYNGNLLPLTGATSVNVPTSILSSRSQGVNGHSDQYIDVGVITATYRAYGVVPPGLLLPPDQQQCSPDQPSPECPDNN